MKKTIVSILVIAVLLSALIYYQRPLRVLAYDWGHAIIGGLYGTTGVPLKVDADGALYVNMTGMTLLYTGVSRGGVSTIASTVTPLATAHLSFALIYIDNGSPGSHPLPDGEADGQEITIRLLANPAYLIIDDTTGDMTKTGWVSILFDHANDWVALTWIDDTYGWIITGSEGVIIEY